MAVYVAWCWLAKLLWQTEPPEGLSVAALVTASSELLGCSLLTGMKRLAQGRSEEQEKQLRQAVSENRALKKQLGKAAEQLKLGGFER
jgi:formiminotetrahydrofolate cyclodeaminase